MGLYESEDMSSRCGERRFWLWGQLRHHPLVRPAYRVGLGTLPGGHPCRCLAYRLLRRFLDDGNVRFSLNWADGTAAIDHL
jgi:hypothetical protein